MQLFLQEFNYEANKHFFLSVFQTLNQVLWEDVFKRLYYDVKPPKFKRKVLIPAFDIITLRTKNNLWQITPDILKQIIESLWDDEIFDQKIWVGPSSETKLKYALWEAQNLLDQKFKWIIEKS
jgi:hypothetical protein